LKKEKEKLGKDIK